MIVTERRWQKPIDAALDYLSRTAMPEGPVGSRAMLGAHLLGKAAQRGLVQRAGWREVARGALMDAIFLETAFRRQGTNQMLRGRHGFFPHIFLPDFHGPHFDEAMRRITFTGRGPNVVYFSTTAACPCRCEYCFAGAGDEKTPDLADEKIFEVAKALADLKAPLVNISGGEPLARYRRLVTTVRLLSEGSEVRMFTTGFGLDEPRLGELREAGLQGVFVSLDGTDREKYDKSRGKTGAFEAAIKALRLCARARMLTFVNCVVGKKRFADAAEIEEFLSFVESIHPDIVINFIPQLATGRGTEADSFRSPDECEEVAQRIVDTSDAMGRPIAMLFGEVDRFMGCIGAGGKLLNVDIFGNVTVCISRATLGNLLDEPFEVIYQRFIESCKSLKVGFFCCKVGESTGPDDRLTLEESKKALADFYYHSENAVWQETLNRFGWLLERVAE